MQIFTAFAVTTALTLSMAACGAAGTRGQIATLTASLNAEDDKICSEAARALGALGPRAADAARPMFDVVVRQRRHLGPTCWDTVVDELPKLGPSATSLLVNALTGDESTDAAYVLASMGPSVLPKLIAALEQSRTADGAAIAIGMLGKAGESALANVRDARRRGFVSEQRFLVTLTWFRSVDTVPDFAAAIDSHDAAVRVIAVRALADFVSQSPEAVAALSRAVQAEDQDLRATALQALSAAGPSAAGALLPILSLLRDPDPAIRAGAVIAIGNIGPGARAAILDLRKVGQLGLVPPDLVQNAIARISTQ